MKNSDINIQKIILMAKRKIIEIKKNGEINALIDRRNRKERKRSILLEDKRKGYMRIHLYIDEKYYNAMAHRVIWTFFKGKIKENYQINHIDGNKKNNDIHNLEIVTAKENTQHAIHILKTKTGWIRESNYSAKITIKDARQIRKIKKENEKLKLKEIRILINNKLSIQQIHAIIQNKCWKE